MKKLKVPSSEVIKKKWDEFSTYYINTMEVNSILIAKKFYNTLTKNYLPIKEPSPFPENCSILEIACGSGRFAEYILTSNPKTIQDYHMMDIANGMIQASKERLSTLIQNNTLNFEISEFDVNNRKNKLIIKEQNAEDLSQYPDNSFDIIFGNLVLHLTESPEKMVKEVYRVLKPGGKVMFSVLAEYERSSFFFIYKDILREYGKCEDDYRSIFHLGTEEIMKDLFKDFKILGFDEATESIPIKDNMAKVRVIRKC
jgi:ubiquinone/menaquinone biosynthesis C-methylase UbiE